VELVGSPPAVGEEQEPEGDLGDEERLAKRERVRVKAPGIALPPQVDPAPAEGEEVHADDEHRVQLVEPKHGRHPNVAYTHEVIEEGTPAPDFDLVSDSGESVRLSGLRGSPVVLYFYPADDTPGCTTEACEFRDEYSRFRQHGAVVLGVSPDDKASHVRFKEKYSLPFTLLADPDHKTAEDYGVWVEKNTYGKKRMGIKRSTFVIDGNGSVARAMYGVKPEGHADQVLEALPG
jgi:thioredoxin-dependent peroxiredoxin